MAQTIQSISDPLVEEAKKQYTTSSLIFARSEEPEPEDNISLLFSIADSLNNLYITLEKIDHVMKMKNLEMQIRAKEKEKRLLSKATSPQAEPSDLHRR